MARAGVRKFTYDTVFTEDGRVLRAPEDQRLSFTPDEIKAARAEAYAEGERAATAEAERAAAQALEGVASQLEAIQAALAGVESELRRDAVELALATARAAAEAALARWPEEALGALFQECVDDLRGAPVAVVQAPAGALEAVRERLRAVAAQAGLALGVDVIEGAGPARIEWSAGAALIDPETALARAREAAERWLAATEEGEGQLNLFAESSAG